MRAGVLHGRGRDAAGRCWRRTHGEEERVDRDGVRDDGAGDEGERDGEEDGQVARVELLRDRGVLHETERKNSDSLEDSMWRAPADK